jgi:hypothetical protein
MSLTFFDLNNNKINNVHYFDNNIDILKILVKIRSLAPENATHYEIENCNKVIYKKSL